MLQNEQTYDNCVHLCKLHTIINRTIHNNSFSNDQFLFSLSVAWTTVSIWLVTDARPELFQICSILSKALECKRISNISCSIVNQSSSEAFCTFKVSDNWWRGMRYWTRFVSIFFSTIFLYSNTNDITPDHDTSSVFNSCFGSSCRQRRCTVHIYHIHRN